MVFTWWQGEGIGRVRVRVWAGCGRGCRQGVGEAVDEGEGDGVGEGVDEGVGEGVWRVRGAGQRTSPAWETLRMRWLPESAT